MCDSANTSSDSLIVHAGSDSENVAPNSQEIPHCDEHDFEPSFTSPPPLIAEDEDDVADEENASVEGPIRVETVPLEDIVKEHTVSLRHDDVEEFGKLMYDNHSIRVSSVREDPDRPSYLKFTYTTEPGFRLRPFTGFPKSMDQHQIKKGTRVAYVPENAARCKGCLSTSHNGKQLYVTPDGTVYSQRGHIVRRETMYDYYDSGNFWVATRPFKTSKRTYFIPASVLVASAFCDPYYVNEIADFRRVMLRHGVRKFTSHRDIIVAID